jgi:phosphonate transport system substrate-binding protein
MRPGIPIYSRCIVLATFACILLGGGSKSYAGEVSEYKFGIFPFMPMAALSRYYNSIGTDFTRMLNKRVIAQSRPTYKEFAEEIEKESYDIIFIQPFDYPTAYEHNYRPIARRVDSLDAILVTKIGSDIKSITDLEGKTLANPPADSAISIVIQKELKNASLDGENAIKMIYTNNHFACIQMVLVGKADACSTTTPVLHHWHETQLKKKKLHAIHQSGSVPHTVYMVHQRVPEKDKEKFKQAILTWDKRPEGKMILKIFNVSSFVEAKDSEYDVIRNYWK